MEHQQAEPPECPVCLTPYDGVTTVPRVIPCGHTTCEACLLLLPHPFPNTIRCPSCTQLVKFPNHPSSLPKNIDLLRFSPQSSIPNKVTSPTDHNLNYDNIHNLGDGFSFVPTLWSHEFYQIWIKWVLPSDVVFIEPSISDEKKSLCTCSRSDAAKDVGLVKQSWGKENNDEKSVKTCGRNQTPEMEDKTWKLDRGCDDANDSGMVERSREKENDDWKTEDTCSEDTILDKRSLEIEDDLGKVVKTWGNDDAAADVESSTKEYCDGKIIKTDAKNDSNNSKALFEGMLRDGEKVGLVKIGCILEENEGTKLRYSYEAKVIKVLYGMGNDERDELELVLSMSLRLHRVGKVYGFWCHEDDNSVYMVCERFNYCLVKVMQGFDHGFKEMVSYGMVGTELSTVVYGLHSEGLVVGCLSASCFGFDVFGHANFDIGKVLKMGRGVCRMISDAVSYKERITDKDLRLRLRNFVLENGVFVSPELVTELTRSKDDLGSCDSDLQVCYGSDVWSLACLLVRLLIGKSFAEEVCDHYLDMLICKLRNEKDKGWLGLYNGWMRKVADLLERRLDMKLVLIKKTLCKCLESDPVNRPSLTELQKCIRELVINPDFDVIESFRPKVAQKSSNHCIVLGKLCQFGGEVYRSTTKTSGGSEEHDDNWGQVVDHKGNLLIEKDVGEGISKGHVKCIDLKGHLDCITGLAIGGGFLFSSSYDKTVKVWSLQDFSHVHSFQGHEHRVMAVAFVDEGASLCISGDNGGVICIWGAKVPLGPEPIKRLCEQKDWRYSGIHALAVSGTQYFYTGSGDKTIKAWSLQDYTLMCIMSGHKSIVSSLAVLNGVLYSGSWDGTVRLWSLSDHSPLAVLGENAPSNMSPVLALAAERDVLAVGHEDGQIKIWHNDRLLKLEKVHDGAILTVIKKERLLFAGGWDKTISVQELYRDGAQFEVTLVGSMPSGSAITALAYWQGKLFAGQADRVIKVYCSRS